MPKVNRDATQEESLFTSNDIDILSHAVSLYPNLRFASYATSLAKKHLKFPIENHKGFRPLFKVKNLPALIASRKITYGHLQKFFPKEFFPVEDSRDFLGRVFAALSWGETIHYHERFVQNPERFSPVIYPPER